MTAGIVLFGLPSVFAQTNQPFTPPQVSDVPKISDLASKNPAPLQQDPNILRERREQAYAKLLEGQRYIWNLSRQRTQAGINSNSQLAKMSLQKAVELDPTLAEGYTALAQLSLTTLPQDLDGGIILANIAVKINPNNFGGHQWLARFHSIKSGLNTDTLDSASVRNAISEWKEVVRLDPRNAEAFAFLSELYNKTDKQPERIEALRNWLASATPLDARFYRAVFGKQVELSPETASLKLGEALINTGETGEAVDILSRAIADNPESEQSIELLRQALETTDGSSVVKAISALQQAVNANPDNISLMIVLAKSQARTGKIEDASNFLLAQAARIGQKDGVSSAVLQVALGDIYLTAERFSEAINAYQNALKVFGVNNNDPVAENEREFSRSVNEKMIIAYKKANRFQDAVQTIRALRAKNIFDASLLRLEATTLTESGKVDEAVTLMNNWVNTPKGYGASSVDDNSKVSINPATDEKFRNYIFISTLYSQAKRGREAVEAANQAYKIAQGDERKQIARLNLATAQQMAGEYSAAETILRELLKESPANPVALNNLGYFLAERGEKLDEALNLIRQAIKADPTSSSYLDSLGWTYFKLGKLDEAEKYLKEALRYDATSVTINEHLGDVHQKQGKTDLAKSAWQKALSFAYEVQETNRLKAKITLKNVN